MGMRACEAARLSMMMAASDGQRKLGRTKVMGGTAGSPRVT